MLLITYAIAVLVLQIFVGPFVLSKICGIKLNYIFIAINMVLVIGTPFTKEAPYLYFILEVLLYLIYLYRCYSQKIWISLFYTAYTVSFVYFIRMFVQRLIFYKLLGFGIHNEMTTLIGYLCVIPTQYLFLKYLAIDPRHLIIEEQEQEQEQETKKRQDQLIKTYSILMIVLFILNNIMRFTDLGTDTQYYQMIFFYAFVFLFMLYSINVKYKEWENQRLLKYKDYLFSNLAVYTHEVDESYKSVRAFRHDFANILISMRETIEIHGNKEVKATYNQILERSNIMIEENHKEVAKLGLIKVLELRSVLSSKILTAEQRGVTVNLEITDIIKELRIDKIDLVRLFGIWLDNAIEAVLETESNLPTVNLAIFNKNGKQYYVVENEMKEKSLRPSKIVQEGYSTKGEYRGHGLANAEKIIDRYPKINYRIQSNDYRFRVELEMRCS